MSIAEKTIENLEAQLNLLKQSSAVPVQVKSSEILPSVLVTEETVRKIVKESLAEFQNNFSNVSQTANPFAEVSKIFEDHLEEAEKVWLSTPEVQQSFLPYLASSNGHEIVRLFVSDFKDFYENKTQRRTGAA